MLWVRQILRTFAVDKKEKKCKTEFMQKSKPPKELF